MSSGKISTYLRYGIPIIVKGAGTYSNIAEEYGIGANVDSIKEISSVIKRLDLTSAGAAASYFFSRYLDFSNYEERVWSALVDAANETNR